jgi:hypothetical protein
MGVSPMFNLSNMGETPMLPMADVKRMSSWVRLGPKNIEIANLIPIHMITAINHGRA